DEVHVQPLGAGQVLLVAEVAGRLAVDRRGEAGEDALEAGLLAGLAPRRLERRLPGLELAADGQPGAEAPVMDDEHARPATGIHGDGEGATRSGHGRSGVFYFAAGGAAGAAGAGFAGGLISDQRAARGRIPSSLPVTHEKPSTR